MSDSLDRLEDEVFPTFLSKSPDSTSGRATLGNETLGSGPGLPVAASTVAKIRPGSDNRWVGAGSNRWDLLWNGTPLQDGSVEVLLSKLNQGERSQ